MARPKEFDETQALKAAIEVFRQYGFEGSSAGMLVQGMKIGRQSLYDTFGDKWRLYLSAVRQYVTDEAQTHLEALQSKPRAMDGIRAMIDRVVADSGKACLGVNSICEFGRQKPDLLTIHDAARRTVQTEVTARLREAQSDGDIAPDLDPAEVYQFLSASFAGIRIASRGGANMNQRRALGRLAMRALQNQV